MRSSIRALLAGMCACALMLVPPPPARGQVKPNEPQLFAPAQISTGDFESHAAFAAIQRRGSVRHACKLKNETCSAPENLGDAINTAMDEYEADGKTLFFASTRAGDPAPAERRDSRALAQWLRGPGNGQGTPDLFSAFGVYY